MGTRAWQTMELRRLEARLQSLEGVANLLTSTVLGRIERVLADFGGRHKLSFVLKDPATTRAVSVASLDATWSVQGTLKGDSLFLTTWKTTGHRDLGNGQSRPEESYVAFEFKAPGLNVIYNCFEFQTDDEMKEWLEATWRKFTTNISGIVGRE